MIDLVKLQQIIGYDFRDVSFLERAVVHRSYLNEYPEHATESNERLEYLGDAVLGLAVAERLYREHPDYDEGRMTRLRSALVRSETLARVARTISLGDFLFLGKGEDSSGGRLKPANLACSFEALIAAIYLDAGFTATKEFIFRLLDEEWEAVMKKPQFMDYKSKLQELIQSRDQKVPEYHVTGVQGPDHVRTFIVEVRIENAVLGSGSGRSKKAAEAEAARQALEKLL